MRRVYLVDSENVGDIWVPLLVQLASDEHVVVFYTQKSPHMSYENVRLLKETEREAEFIKCFEGSNALDFQLVTELGYRLKQDETCEYVIVSNDTGFDAVVRYWTRQEMPVRRLSGKDCHKQLTQQTSKKASKAAKKTETKAPSELISMNEAAMPSETAAEYAAESQTGTAAEHTAESQTGTAAEYTAESQTGTAAEHAAESHTETAAEYKDESVPDDEETKEILPDTENDSRDGILGEAERLCICIGSDNLADFHNALVMLFGEDSGKDMYQKIKSDPEIAAYWKGLPEHSQEEKFDIYCQLVFAESDIAAEDVPDDFAAFLWKSNSKRKNLNSLRAALQNHYGKERGMKYYSLFKSHIKIMNRM